MNEHDLYCIRCGKPLHSSEAHYSKDDPDREEAMCYDCYNRLEPNGKPKISIRK